MDIDQRKKEILFDVVKEYVENAEPVSSAIIRRKYHVDVSPATIRNEMSYLEEAGYLAHPHTSAGRVPTDKGYRFYVNNLMTQAPLSSKDKALIEKAYYDLHENMDDILEHTVDVLMSVSNYLGLVTERIGIVNKLLGNVRKAAAKEKKDKFYFSGLSRLLDEPEFEDVVRVRKLLNVFENKDRACLMFNAEDDSEEVVVKIGNENKCAELKDYSVVSKKFHYKNEPVGTVGIVGPKRMRYSRVTAAVEHIAKSLDELITSL